MTFVDSGKERKKKRRKKKKRTMNEVVVTRHWKIEIRVYTSSCETTLPSLSIKGVGVCTAYIG